MKLFEPLQRATFVSRPNRFVVIAEREGELIEAYLSNPGRLSELLFVGVPLLVQSTVASKGRMDWRVVGLAEGQQSICLHTHSANDVAEFLINQGLIRSLAGWQVIKREVKVSHSRFDLLLEKDGVRRLGEVKSCTLFSKSFALFPDAPSLRAKKHIETLAALSRDDGSRPLVLFIVAKQGPRYFVPDWHTDLEFSQALLAAKDQLDIQAVAISTDLEFNLSPETQTLPILWDLVGREAENRGAYLYLLELDTPQQVAIGGLGEIEFPKGVYVYVGSEAVNLDQRLARHRRLKKKPQEPLDWLRPHARHVATLPIRTQDDLECSLASGLGGKADFKIKKFGCSGCLCDSHLFGFTKNPMEEPWFYNFLFHHRIERYLDK